MNRNTKIPAVWCLDATCIAGFDSMDEAMRAWHEIEDGIMVQIGDNEFWVEKDHICVITEEEFNNS